MRHKTYYASVPANGGMADPSAFLESEGLDDEVGRPAGHRHDCDHRVHAHGARKNAPVADEKVPDPAKFPRGLRRPPLRLAHRDAPHCVRGKQGEGVWPDSKAGDLICKRVHLRGADRPLPRRDLARPGVKAPHGLRARGGVDPCGFDDPPRHRVPVPTDHRVVDHGMSLSVHGDSSRAPVPHQDDVRRDPWIEPQRLLVLAPAPRTTTRALTLTGISFPSFRWTASTPATAPSFRSRERASVSNMNFAPAH